MVAAASDSAVLFPSCWGVMLPPTASATLMDKPDKERADGMRVPDIAGAHKGDDVAPCAPFQGLGGTLQKFGLSEFYI